MHKNNPQISFRGIVFISLPKINEHSILTCLSVHAICQGLALRIGLLEISQKCTSVVCHEVLRHCFSSSITLRSGASRGFVNFEGLVVHNQWFEQGRSAVDLTSNSDFLKCEVNMVR